MSNVVDFTTVKLQIALNKRMYDIGKIPYDIYSKANEILSSKLTYTNEHDMIIHSEKK